MQQARDLPLTTTTTTTTKKGEEVHKYLGEKQLAPRLISCSQLPGGWCAVIMEKIYGSTLASPVSAEVKTALEKAVEVMQSQNLEIYIPKISLLLAAKSVYWISIGLEKKVRQDIPKY